MNSNELFQKDQDSADYLTTGLFFCGECGCVFSERERIQLGSVYIESGKI